MKLHSVALVVDFQLTIKPFSLSWSCYRIFLLLVVHFSPRSTEKVQRSSTNCQIFRRFRTTALPIVSLTSLRRMNGSTKNKPHSLTKHKIQTQTAKLGQAVR